MGVIINMPLWMFLVLWVGTVGFGVSLGLKWSECSASDDRVRYSGINKLS
jgi:hypothetical protein